METKKYNGWNNYETWSCMLWIDNDGSGEHFRERAEELMADDPDSAIYNLAQEIDDWVDENDPIGDQPSMYSDILRSALREIDYYEIAEHIISDLDLVEEEEEEITE